VIFTVGRGTRPIEEFPAILDAMGGASPTGRTPSARVEGSRLIYDVGAQQSLAP
jgi:hypothetical protein